MQGEWVREQKNGSSVVFVHGILSSGETCWRHKNGSYWPDLLKNESGLDELGIYVFTYQTGVFSGNYRLGDAVDSLKEHMRLDGLFDNRRIIFVCHSMGGIVVRKFLVERQAELIEGKTEIGLFLVASPSLGSSYANWLSPLAQFFGHSQAAALRFQQENAWLNDLDKEFQNMKEAGRLKIKGKELIEDKFPILGQKQVVEPFSGARYFGEPYKVPQSDHFSIAKPLDEKAIQHRMLCQFIKRLTPKQNPDPPAAPSEKPAPSAIRVDEEEILVDLRLLDKAIGHFNDACGIFDRYLILPTHCDDAERYLNNVLQSLHDMVAPLNSASAPLTSKQFSMLAKQHKTDEIIINDLIPGIKSFRSVCSERNSTTPKQKQNIQRELDALRSVLKDMQGIH